MGQHKRFLPFSKRQSKYVKALGESITPAPSPPVCQGGAGTRGSLPPWEVTPQLVRSTATHTAYTAMHPKWIPVRLQHPNSQNYCEVQPLVREHLQHCLIILLWYSYILIVKSSLPIELAQSSFKRISSPQKKVFLFVCLVLFLKYCLPTVCPES